MKLTRRGFLAAGGALAASTLVPGRLIAAVERHAPPAPRLSTWAEVRAQFRLDPRYLHFASFYLASHPRPVQEAIETFRRALDANPFLMVEHSMFESELQNLQLRVCESVAGYIGGRREDLALTGNTTTGLALVYHGLKLAPGDEVLTTEHDHYSHHESIRFATERAGASMRRIALFEEPENAAVSGIVERIRSAIQPNTRALGVTWVHSSSGVRLPIREIAKALGEVNRAREEKDGVLLVVDGVHGLGAVDERPAEMGCDFFCAGTHKWMFGPRGTGVVWGNPKAWARLRPLVPTFSEKESFDSWMRGEPPKGPMVAARMTPGGFTAYEHQWGVGAAFRFHQRIGRERIAARIRALNDQCKAGLAGIKRVRLRTPRDPALSAGLCCFEVEGRAPGDVVKGLLAHRIVASTSPYRVEYVRLAPSLVNSREEVERALVALRKVVA